MSKIEELRAQMDDFGFSTTYHVHLLSKHKQEIDQKKILKSMNNLLGNTELLSSNDVGESVDKKTSNGFVHTEYKMKDGIFAQTLLFEDDHFSADGKPILQVDEMTLKQTWDFPEGKELASECKHSITLFIMLAGGLDYHDRITLFQRSLAACLEHISCDIIFHKKINKLISPAQFLEGFYDRDPLAGVINVRFFNVTLPDGKNSMFLDTCGLAIIGLPDLQCFFNDFDPTEMAHFLLNMAYYIFEKGDIINDGETTGRTTEERWICNHEYSSVEPHRLVLNIDTSQKDKE